MIKLRSLEWEEFVVTEKVAKMSITIRHIIEDGCGDSAIPLLNVKSEILRLVIEYCKKHAPEEKLAEGYAAMQDEKEMETWDQEFVNVLEQPMLINLIWAANYLNVEGLLDLTCKKVAQQMTGKTPEQIREIFQITNDYSPEEEAEVRREYQWAFE